MLPIISINGHIEKANTPVISPFDRGFTLGDGLFETLNVTNGTPWYLTRHLDRLTRAATRLGIAVPSTLQQWIGDVLQHATDAGITDHVLRITITRGIALTHGLAGNPDQSPTVVIAAFAKPNISTTTYERGLSAHVTPARRNEHAATAGLKTTSYLESVLALRDAQAAGYDDAIFLDTRGFVAEASASNIFIWRNRTLLTPPHTCGILPGITRAIILELAAHAGITTAEYEFTERDLLLAEEVFLTSSLRGIVPVSRIDRLPIGLGAPGPATHQMMARYANTPDRL